LRREEAGMAVRAGPLPFCHVPTEKNNPVWPGKSRGGPVSRHFT